MVLNGAAANVLAAFFLLFCGLIGFAAGGLVHLFARRRWGWKAAVADWALAVGAVIVFEVALTLVSTPQIAADWSPAPEVVVAPAVVVARRLAPPLLRRAAAAANKPPG